MKRSLSVGEKITIFAFNEQKDFVIKEILGVGGSCIAYKVKYYEDGTVPHIGILKEYCPAFLEKYDFSRNGSGLVVPVEIYDAFSEGLIEFKNTYKYINEYLSENISATNYHPVQLGYFEGNNTAYTLTACDYGKSYDKIDDTNLLSICKIMLSVTKAVELYHKEGFLHLDIKPKNILILNEVTELIKLFDYDSLTSIEKLKRGEVTGIPMPEDFYVDELENYSLRDIGIHTDIFEIGATLFMRVFKRKPESYDMSYDSKYDLDNNDFFVGVSPQAKNEFIELLKNTLQISKRLRYKTTVELKQKLEKIIALLNDEKPYLIDMPKWQPSKHCIGRKNELKEIKSRLDKDGYVFVKGIGGLGKSEIAKLFAKEYVDEYHTVQFYQYSDSLKSLVGRMSVCGINDSDYKNADELVKAKNRVLHLSDNKTLIIVDNFNVTYDDFLREFLPTDNKSFKVIFTTRCSMAAEYYDCKTYELPKLSIEDCKQLFYSHSCVDVTNESDIEKLIEFVDYNTLIIILSAITVKKSGITVNEMFEKIQDQEIDAVDVRIFHEYDFSTEEVNAYNKINCHLTTIFSICALDEIQKEILKNATLISVNGIGVDDFTENCGVTYINQSEIDKVVSLGWLNKDSNNIISMHPIVSDLLAFNKEIEKKESFYNFSDYLEEFCNPELCHFSVVLNKLACAKHLYRRCKFESNAKIMTVCTKLGRMYENIYQPVEAKKYLKKALSMALDLGPDEELRFQGECVKFKGQYKNVFIAYLYSFIGNVEKNFGTKENAIKYYKQSIEEGKKIENRFYSLVVESMMSIAECYSDNNNYIEAYNSYLEGLIYAKKFKLYEYITEISDELIEICNELNWLDKLNVYQKTLDKYSHFSEKVETLPGMDEFSKKAEILDFEGMVTAYENVLSVQREKLSEDSPLYKDLKTNLWVFYAANEQKEQAMKLLNEDLTFIEQTSGANSLEMAKYLASAAKVFLKYMDFDAIEKLATRAINICEQLNDTKAYPFVESNLALATMLHVQGRNDEAKICINKVDFSAYSGTSFLGDIVSSAGIVLTDLSEFDVVEPICLELLDKTSTDLSDRFTAHIILSSLNEQRGNIDAAEWHAEEAHRSIEVLKTTSIQKEWLALYYRARAKICYRKGNFEQGVRILDECISAFKDENEINYVLNVVYMERGLYQFCVGNLNEANSDYNSCEEILRKYNLPESAYITLYNNISLIYESTGEYVKAKEYLDKIITINPKVLNPSAYFEAIVCGNLGWVAYNLGDIKQSIECLSKSKVALERLGLDNILDSFKVKNNLAIAYASQNKFEDSYNEYMDIRMKYDVVLDSQGEIAISSNLGVILSLLKNNKPQEAYNFSCEELERFEKWFGKTSPIRIKAILQMGGLFREFGYSDCYDFFFLADELMDESEDFNSLNNAKLLNYIGLYLTDEKKEHGLAKNNFEESKELFEKLGATDDEMYPVVIKNIEYVRDLIMDDLIKEMAKTMIEEQGDN